MAFEARQSTVGKLLNDSIYRIPRNQRAYVWDEHNWKDLFEDIKLVTEEVATSHFIGSIVLMEECGMVEVGKVPALRHSNTDRDVYQ